MRFFTYVVAWVAPASSLAFDTDDDALSLLQVRATQPGPDCKDAWDPYCGVPPEPDGQLDTEQTPMVAHHHGPCFIPPLEADGYPKGHHGSGTSAEQAIFRKSAQACPNTVDNHVLRGDASYKVMYPDWQCGQPTRMGGPHYGQVDSSKGVTVLGMTYASILPEGLVKDLPWTVHADACITWCKQEVPMEPGSQTYAVQVYWGKEMGSVPVKEAVVKKGQAIQCICATAATMRSGGKPLDYPNGACNTKVVWLGDPHDGADDEAEAVGDPHLTVQSGKKSDLCCDGGECHACQPVLLEEKDTDDDTSVDHLQEDFCQTGTKVNDMCYDSRCGASGSWNPEGDCVAKRWKMGKPPGQGAGGCCKERVTAICTGPTMDKCRIPFVEDVDDEADDEAEAVGDPHITTRSGKKFDLQ